MLHHAQSPRLSVNPMNIAIEFNNAGATMLERDQIANALYMFNSAIKLMLNAAQSVDSSSTSFDVEDQDLQTRRAYNMLQMHHEKEQRETGRVKRTGANGKITQGEEHNQSQNKQQQMMCSFMFDQPIRIPKSYVSKLHSVGSAQKFYSSVMLYNKALIHHLNGGEASVRKSLRLYEMSFHIVRQLEDQSTGEDDAILNLLIMALLNNMGQIQYDLFCDYQDSAMYLDQLQQFALYAAHVSQQQQAVATPSSHQSEFVLQTDLIETFILNSVMYQNEPSNAAAA